MKKIKREYVFDRLSYFKRMRIAEDRDLVNGLRLNRNERVEDFPKDIIQKIFKNVPKYNLGKYPDHSKIYDNLSKFLNLKKNRCFLYLVSFNINGLLFFISSSNIE